MEVRNRVKGLDLRDRVPDELWARFMTLYRRHGSIFSLKKEMQTSKWLSKEALQIAVRRREMKSKGEKKRYTHLNAEFQK